MPELSPKKREIQQRETLILSVAENILYQHGYNYLTMDRVAEAVEYSKGTIYNHFASKEDLICTLGCLCLRNLIAVFEQAHHYPGTTRERYCAIGIGYSIYHQLHPMDRQNIQAIRSNAVREKISDQKLIEMASLEHKITEVIRNIVQHAIDCGELDKKYQTNINTIVFAFWSMHYGALLLEQSDIPLSELGFNPVVSMLWENANIYLDGCHWLPLSTDTDTDALFNKISAHLFSDEINYLKQTG